MSSHSQNQVDQFFNNSYYNNFSFNTSNTSTSSLSSAVTTTATTNTTNTTGISSNLFHNTLYSNPTVGYSNIRLLPTQSQSSQSSTSTKTSNAITPIGYPSSSSSSTSQLDPLSFLSMTSSFMTSSPALSAFRMTTQQSNSQSLPPRPSPSSQTSTLSPWNNTFSGFNHPSSSTLTSSASLTSPFLTSTDSLLQPSTLSKNYSNTPPPSSINMPSYSVHGSGAFSNGILAQVNANGQSQINTILSNNNNNNNPYDRSSQKNKFKPMSQKLKSQEEFPSLQSSNRKRNTQIKQPRAKSNVLRIV